MTFDATQELQKTWDRWTAEAEHPGARAKECIRDLLLAVKMLLWCVTSEHAAASLIDMENAVIKAREAITRAEDL